MNAAEIIDKVARAIDAIEGWDPDAQAKAAILATLDAIPELEGDVRAKMLSDGITAHVDFGDVVTLGQAEMRMAAILIAMIDALKREVTG